MALAPAHPGAEQAAWIQSRRWDLTWLIGSALVVPIVVVMVWAGASSLAINIGVTALVGGPHLFSTYTATYLDPRFRRSHRLGLLAVSLAIPAFVLYFAINNLQILLSVFIFLASVHVLQQNAYLSDVYRRRLGHPEPTWSRLVDYGVLMLSFYPVAAFKLVHGTFSLGDTRILIPSFLLIPGMYWAVWLAFGAFLLAWIGKTWSEHRQGLVNRPKTLLIGLTVTVAFFVPMLESTGRLELVFQAVNAWHSIQYLGIVLLVQRIRMKQGLIESPAIRWLNSGRANLRTYGTCLAVTLGLIGVIGLIARADPLQLSYQQYYFGLVLSALLIHYALDAYLFAVSMGRRDVPFAVLARRTSPVPAGALAAP
jgi:hypothetical protein